MENKNFKIGFIGQGWIGKNLANNFEKRDFDVVRYGLEAEYIKNKGSIKDCDITFIAVPTPTTTTGFNFDAIKISLALIGKGKIAVIKSTILPGTTNILQKEFSEIIVLHSPEFLREATAENDTDYPERNLVGYSEESMKNIEASKKVLSVLPKANYSKSMLATQTELIKYAGNCFLFTKVIFFNLMQDLATSLEVDFEEIREAVGEDNRIGHGHTKVLHASGHDENKKEKRGAGGHCFIKDMEALRSFTHEKLNDEGYDSLIESFVKINNNLLIKSGKDLDLLRGVYGEDLTIKEFKK